MPKRKRPEKVWSKAEWERRLAEAEKREGVLRFHFSGKLSADERRLLVTLFGEKARKE